MVWTYTFLAIFDNCVILALIIYEYFKRASSCKDSFDRQVFWATLIWTQIYSYSLLYCYCYSRWIRPSVLFPFQNLFENFIQTIGMTPWAGDQPVARPLPIQDNTTTRKKPEIHPCLESDSKLRSLCSTAYEKSFLRTHAHFDRHLTFHVSISDSFCCVDSQEK
jgi:hypothetical protein